MPGMQPRTFIVTGASSGIGEATALALALSGHDVVAVARREYRLGDLQSKSESAPGRVFTIVADITVPTAAADIVSQALTLTGRIDGLVNNAGIMLLGPLEGAEFSEWFRMLDLNLLALLRITLEALPHLIAAAALHGQADIVMLSSVAGRVIAPGSGMYSVSKFAVNAFAESLRGELASKRVRVSTVEPGMVMTELTSHVTDSAARERVDLARTRLEALQADDVAASISFIVNQPAHVALNEILIRPTQQS